MKRSNLLMFLVCVLTLLFSVATVAQADWDPDLDSHKMHFPQMPQVDMGWDVCLHHQWLADDFVCSETGTIDDIHVWVSFLMDVEDMPLDDPGLWDISIWDDVGGVPGNMMWRFTGGNIQVQYWWSQGVQGWVCPSSGVMNPGDHVGVHQINFTELANPMIQEEGQTYWLVINFVQMSPPGMPPAVGWKTADIQSYPAPGIFQSPALWSPDPFGGFMWSLIETYDGSHDLAFVITGNPIEDDLDFGDAPENDSTGAPTSYPTTLANDGARHVADGVNYLGQLEDLEPDGQPTLPADGDDINPAVADDEDGVTFVNGGLTAGVGEPVDVFVSPVGGPGGYLNVWIDYNADFDWDDPGEWVLVDYSVAGGMNNLTITAPAGAAVGPTYARFRYTTYQISGSSLIGHHGQADDGEVEDYRVEIMEEQPEEYSKWIQRPHGPEEGFDEASNIWIHEETEIIKWEQPPNGQFSGLHSHDYDSGGYYGWVKCADDFQCQGGDITDLHWWGNYEGNNPAGGISSFHLSLHRCDMQPFPWHLPMEPEAWGWDVPFAMCNQTDTGIVNNMGEIIYSYKVDLPDPYPQTEGEWYWLDVMALSNDPLDAAIWRWQEAQRAPMPMGPLGHAPAAQRTDSLPWQSIIWSGDPEHYSDMAFAITSKDTITVPEVNKVVADDFVSDGRVIKKVRWWGSYFDDRYDPFIDPIEPYVVDGWIVSFHHTRDDDGTNLPCPPDIMAGSTHPTALGLYFAPAYAVEIIPTGIWDCHGHSVYEYKVDLSQCELLCQEVDPRSGMIPAQPDAFYEEECFGYWLDIVAVVGAIWDNGEMIYTDHIPPLDSPFGWDFWGWHTSPDAYLQEACSGQIVDMTPPAPSCWDYGNWYKIPWQCPTGVNDPVNMSFELVTPEEPCFTGTPEQVAAWNSYVPRPLNWCDPCFKCGDVNSSGDVTTADWIQIWDDLKAGDTSGRSDANMTGDLTTADWILLWDILKAGLGCTPCI